MIKRSDDRPDEHDPQWQMHLRDELRLQGFPRLGSRSVFAVVDDYLDHHGQLAQLMLQVADELYDDAADQAREILHRHQLAIFLLLEQIEAHEWHRIETADLGRRLAEDERAVADR